MRYMIENAGAGYRLIQACVRHGVKKFVLSSTANLFGHPDEMPITETAPHRTRARPTARASSRSSGRCTGQGEVHGLRCACLRYFNAAGADPEGVLGEDHDPETHLIPLAIDAALGRRPQLVVFGTDYPTPDGTAIRDYVHVTDLGQAHLLALGQLDTAQRHLQSRQRRRPLGAGRDRLGRARAGPAGAA